MTIQSRRHPDLKFPQVKGRSPWWRRAARRLWVGVKRLGSNAWFVAIAAGIIVAALVWQIGW